MSSLLSFSVKDGILHFDLGSGVCQSKLKVKNVSNKRVMYKVKTTQPMWYFVRPNFDVLDAGEEVEVNVVLIDEEKSRYIALYRQGKEESVSKHRFMVQYGAMAKASGDEVMKMKQDSKGDPKGMADLTPYWSKEGANDGVFDGQKESAKFKVSYTYSQPITNSDVLPSSQGSVTSSVGSGGGKTTEIPRASSKKIPETPQEMEKELVKLREDYDRLIDAYYRINSEKEKLEQDREIKKDELAGIRATPVGGFMLGSSDDRPGFSLIFFMVSAIIAFFLGSYLST
jgi:hypothetical protein